VYLYFTLDYFQLQLHVQSGNKENQATCTPLVENRANSVASFARAFLSQDLIQGEETRQPLVDITNGKQPNNQLPRKRKRARLLLDARTELTDDELKVNPYLSPLLLRSDQCVSGCKSKVPREPKDISERDSPEEDGEKCK